MVDYLIEIVPYYEKAANRIKIINGKPYYTKSASQGTKINGIVGNLTKKGYRRFGVTINGKVKRLMVHKVSWYMDTGEIHNTQIDHKDHDKDNNDITNLRKATNGQNQLNTPKRLGATSIYKGVCHHGRDGHFRSQLTYNRKLYRLGSYDDEAVAANAYDQALVDFDLLEFGILNFPDKLDFYLSKKGIVDYRPTDLTKYDNRLNLKPGVSE